MIISVTVTDSKEDQIVDAVKSVVDHVDRVLLVDTGIKDRTAERAKEIAGKKFAITKHEWAMDFSAARNAGLTAARGLGAHWIVIVDSDERLDLTKVNLREELERTHADALLIYQDDRYTPKEKIVRASSNAHFAGPTHEALQAGSRATLKDATFTELAKTQEQLKRKFERDVWILTAHISKYPNDPRWWFYLGVSYEGLDDRENAAKAFGTCVAKSKIGDGLEAAWAAYKQAEQLYILERFQEAIDAAARGIAANATFAECAWMAALASFKLDRRDQAVAWGRIAEAVGRYKGCGPMERPWFQHLPAMYELPYDVLRFALPDEAGRREAEADMHAAKLARMGAEDGDIEQLSVSRNASHANRNEARAMLRPAPLRESCPSARSEKIKFDPPNGWRPMNPSICRHQEKLMCVVRTVNYSMSGKQYTIDDADGIVRTQNYIGELDAQGQLLFAHAMRDLDPSPREQSNVVGYEDIRLVSVEGKLTGSATVCDRDASRRLIAHLEFDDFYDIVRATVQPSNQQHEKNWMPMNVNGKLAWIYSLDPTAILPGPLRSCGLQLDHLRGGAATPLGGGNGYLCVVHEVIDANEGRIYLHRFAHLDEDFVVTGVSPAWVFDKYGIEFCSGIAADGDEIILSYGVDDREAWIMRVAFEEIDEMEWITP